MATTLAPAIPKLTYADLDLIPKEREGDRQELFDGELVVTPSPIPAHQLVTGNLLRGVGGHVVGNDLGRVYVAPIDVKFAPGSVAVPDLVFVRRERLEIVGAKAILGAPDLIIEVLSPSTKRRDLGRKKAMYERFGVPEYWVTSIDRRTITLFVLQNRRYEELTQGKDGPRSIVLPDLDLRWNDIFFGVEG